MLCDQASFKPTELRSQSFQWCQIRQFEIWGNVYKILHNTSRIFGADIKNMDISPSGVGQNRQAQNKQNKRGSLVLRDFKTLVLNHFSYPKSLAVLFPCAIFQLLSKALLLPAVDLFVTGPHFTLQPAGGRQVPQQHCMVVVHLTLGYRHWHILPYILPQEIWNGHIGNINTLIVNCPSFTL